MGRHWAAHRAGRVPIPAPPAGPYFTGFTVLDGANLGFTWWSPILRLNCEWHLYEDDIDIENGLINTDLGDNGYVCAASAQAGCTYYVTLVIIPYPQLETVHKLCL